VTYDEYHFGREFQTKVVALMVRDASFLRNYYEVVEPTYFTFDILRMISRWVFDYFDRYNVPPTREALMEKAEEETFRLKIFNDQERIFTTIDFCFKCDLSDAQFIRDEIIKFGKTIALQMGITQIIELLKDPTIDNYEEARGILERALSVGIDVTSRRFDFNDFKLDPVSYLRDYMDFNPAYIVKTPWSEINRDLLIGGLGLGQLGVIMGGSGLGKSVFLINIAYAAVHVQRKPTFYFPIGDLKEPDIALRYLARLYGISTYNIYHNKRPDDLSSAIEKYRNQTQLIDIAYFSPATVTVQSLRSYITKVVAMRPEMRPGLIIVDYADNLLPIRHRGKGTYLEMGSIYEDLICMGNDFLCPVWTATQPQRWGLTEEILDVANVGESWKKISHADLVLTINISRTEKTEKRCRVFTAKVRRGKSKQLFNFDLDYDLMIAKETKNNARHKPTQGIVRG